MPTSGSRDGTPAALPSQIDLPLSYFALTTLSSKVFMSFDACSSATDSSL